MTKRQKSIEFQRTPALTPVVAAGYSTAAAYATPFDIVQDAVDVRIREMFCDAVAEPLPPEIHALLAHLQGKTLLN
ncbi:hypothetical protein [Nitrospirillum viridazoti]|uniref:Uncharacterized protein n=1 Tax=Nitrospirillum viridazoti CBAmc TaxID=1441467 RepID=A0A248JPN0_9PROT|nr:hypothetical protein [Nitrospirillum amazonense]ASG20667.1 hypothetical protein Y958_07500 [Nitrospirillum amazonense CBAmc]TWB34298.1 hypothetical protein FBZ91_112195 [Nitrospirillum amazonense]